MAALTAQERDRQRRRIVISDKTTCHHCKSKGLKLDEKHCPNCGFPQQGNEVEQRRFIVGVRKKKSEINEGRKNIRYGTRMLFLVAGLNGVSYIGTSGADLVVGIIISGIYVFLAFLSKKKPFPSIMTGLILYFCLYLLYGLLDPMNLVAGIIFKIMIIGALIYALYAVKDIERLNKEIEL
ncbi:MAG: ribosomal protein L37E [Saprospiraceae bacterium]|jgi:ribosomal protein L37E